MIENYATFQRADVRGHIIIPRRLLELMQDPSDPSTQKEAAIYVHLLTKAKYATDESEGGLERGELKLSKRELCMRFSVNARTIDRYLARLQEHGIISLTPIPGSKLSRLKLLCYDNLCRLTDRTPGGVVRTRKADEDFIVFWDRYHSMTGMPELEIETARCHWNRLTAEERKLAIANVAAYVCTQQYDRLRTAANYLLHKSFYV